MKRNMGNADRITRGIIGIILVAIGIMYIGFWWGILLLVVGLILLFTAVTGWCPLYLLLKTSTLKK